MAAVANAHGTFEPRLLTSGDPVSAGDTVGFADGALGGIELADGTRVLTTSGMLLWIGEADAERELSLAYGEALVESGTTGVLVSLADGVVEVPAGASVLITARNDRTKHVDLLQGQARVGWNAGSVELAENTRARPLAGGLGWARRTLTRFEINRRGHRLAGQSRAGDLIPLLAEQPPPDDGDIYDPTPLCDSEWHAFPWVECRLTGWGCACYDSRHWRWFYYDRWAEDEPRPTNGPIGPVADTSETSGEDEEKDLPEEAGDHTTPEVDTSGIVDGALVLGTDRAGNVVSWRGRSASGFTKVLIQENEAAPRFYAPDRNGSTYVSGESHAATSPGYSSYQSGSSRPNTSSYGEFGGGGSSGGSPSRGATVSRGSSGGRSSSGSTFSSGSSSTARSRAARRSKKK